MTYDFKELDSNITNTKEWLKKEFMQIRTGRANTAVLDSVRVDAYGQPSPLNQVASVGVEDACTIRISPWDTSLLGPIEKAIVDSELGLGVSNDGKGIRVTFPELTEERRKEIAKMAKAKLEEAKIAVRQARDEVWTNLQKKEKEGEISEDEKFTAKERMEEKVSAANKDLEEMYKKKEGEILSV